jgi:serine/threonine-protein kinase
MFPQIFGKYVLERELASGGMARVFLATLRGAGGFEKRLVVKQIRPELASDQSFIQRFVAEAKTTVELSHANIVPVYELGTEQGVYYIAMEFCEGVPLAELLKAGAASPAEGAYIGVEMCRALDYAHRKAGVVHRDVTPRNVMIDREGMVRLIDFGIAAPASSDRVSGPAFGSPGHMPPEQLGPGPLTPAADVFAVAVLLVEAWTGRAPFRRESLAASARAMREPRPELSAAHSSLAALEPLIRSALAHAPRERPQTAEEFARPLREFLRQDDLGDIARRLGARVSERLREMATADARAQTASSAPSASQPLQRETGGASGTQTFAARGALLEWTAKIESTPPRPSASSVGSPELESGLTAPTPSDSPRSAWSRSRRRALAVALGVGLIGLTGLGGRVWLEGRAPSIASGSERAPANEPATAITEAPIAIAVADPSASSAASGVVMQPRGPSRTVSAQTGAAALVGERTPAAPALPRSAVAAASGVVMRPQRAATAPDASPPSRSSGAPAPAAVASLQLTADPAAWVEVDAVRVGRTPLTNHAVSPGRHTITFVNQLLDERLEATVSVDAAHAARVHADFSSANPRVYVR